MTSIVLPFYSVRFSSDNNDAMNGIRFTCGRLLFITDQLKIVYYEASITNKLFKIFSFTLAQKKHGVSICNAQIVIQ